jgi:hypothetical protein
MDPSTFVDIQSLDASVPRTRITPREQPINHDQASQKHRHYQTALVDELRSELGRLQIDTSAVNAADFDWLPRSGFDTLKLNKFRTCPVLTTNSELRDVLDLQLSTLVSPPLALGTHYYVRCWSFNKDELLAVIRYMKNDDHFSQETRLWKSITLDPVNANNSNTVYTIRYVGSVEGPRRPIDRYLEDLGSRTSGLLAEFAKAIAAVCPRNEAAAQTYLVNGASMHENESTVKKENVERLLIALFDHPSLLNRQTGGYLVSYIPPATDLQAFRDLHTNVGARFHTLSTSASPSLVRSVTQHFLDLQTYANSNPEECGTTKHQITNELHQIMTQQGMPRPYKDFTLSVFVGKDAPIESFTSPTMFLDEETHAGGFMRQVVESIAQNEDSNRAQALSSEDFQPYKDLFCFVDFWAWLRHKRLAPAAHFLRSYLQITRPLIVPLFGLPPSDLGLSNFDAECDRRLHILTPVVAIPCIRYFDTPDARDMHDENSAFIAIPSIHPGRDKHGSDVQPIRRLIDMSTRFTYLLIEIAMDVVDDAKEVTRLAICQEILRRLQGLAHNHTRLLDLLTTARLDAESYFRQSMVKSDTDNTRFLLHGDAFDKLVAFGVASGVPESIERVLQVEQLWHENNPHLHMVIPHRLEYKEAWKRQFAKLQPRQFLLLAAITDMDPSSYQDKIISLFQPHWQLPDSWLDGHPYKLAFGLWIHRGDVGSLKHKTLYPDQAVTAHELQARPVGFQPNGMARIR